MEQVWGGGVIVGVIEWDRFGGVAVLVWCGFGVGDVL